MNTSYNWLKELTGLDWSAEEMGEKLTLCGTACEYIVPTDRYMDKVVVGHVLKLSPIEGADKIKKATIDIGSEKLELVCGAPNIEAGHNVPVALVGAEMAEGLVIKKAKIRGIESSGMVCSERELGLSTDHSGIMVLDANAPIGKPLADYLDYHDHIMTFELTPNRPDSMSAIGIARDLAALASIKINVPKIELTEVSEKASDYISVKTEDQIGCPRYAARIIKNIKVGPSPWWLQKKLMSSGVRPISNIVDITNLVMLESGHPLHAFDYNRFGSKEVVVRKAKDKEKFTTLDNQEHELTPEVLLITNGNEAVAAGGVMGGLNSEVSDDTIDILLEAAYFNPGVIRKSRKKLGIVSESSQRFEKGADPNGIEYAINRAAALMAELAGGKVLSGIVDCYPKPIKPLTVNFRPKRCNKLLGATIDTEKMATIFSDLGFTVEKDDTFKVTVPTFRPDIEREVDLIEEVARIIGYDNIPLAETNKGPLFTPYHPYDRVGDEIRTLLTASGFDEIITHGLTDSNLADIVEPGIERVRIINPVSEELDVMRTSVVDTALFVISHNLAHRNLDLRFFEVGRVYYPPDTKGNWREADKIMLAVTGASQNTWREKPSQFDFYDLKAGLEQLATHFHLPAFNYSPAKVNFLEDELSFEIVSGDQVIGRIGSVTKKVLKKFGIKQTIFVAEVDLSHLIKHGHRKLQFESLPTYPAAPRDLSIVIEEHFRAGEIIEQVRKTAGSLAESVDIFDVYAGEQIEKGKRSIAFSIVYRSPKRNLESAEVDKLQEAVVAMLKDKFNAEVRDS